MPAYLIRPCRCALARFLALTATATALLLMPAGAIAAEKGLQTDLSWGTTAQEQDQTMQVLRGTHVQWIRLDISWRNTERTPGAYDADNLALTDNAIALAEQTGAKVIMMVNESPEWASGSTNPNTPPRDPADFAEFVRDMASRYAGRVAAWEIWNEPNHPRFWAPAPDAAGYAGLLQAAAPAVRAGDPAAKVLFAGIAFNDYEYLERVYAAAPAIGDSFDAMATHPYTAGGQSPAIVDRALDGRMTTKSFLAFEEVRNVMRAHGDERPIWLTEFGWSTNSLEDHPLGGVSEQEQADYLELAYKLLEAAPYVEVAVVYNLRNNYWAGDADNWEDQLGLLTTDFSPKPAFTVFKHYTEPPNLVAAPRGSATAPPAPGAEPGDGAEATTMTTFERSGGPTINLVVRRLASTTASVSRVGAGRVYLRVAGRVSSARRGSVRIVMERRVGATWQRAHVSKAPLRGARFARKLSVPRGERWRLTAIYSSADGRKATTRPVTVRG